MEMPLFYTSGIRATKHTERRNEMPKITYLGNVREEIESTFSSSTNSHKAPNSFCQCSRPQRLSRRLQQCLYQMPHHLYWKLWF